MPVRNRTVSNAAERGSIPVPREFLTQTIAQIDDQTELHVTLAIFRLAADSGSTPPAVSEDAVLRDAVLGRTFPEDRRSSKLAQRIRRGLQYATARESVVQVVLTIDGHDERWYVPASAENRTSLERVIVEPGAWPVAGTEAIIAATAPSVFSLYEKNIGMLTPLLTDQIETAMELYPLGWIEDAIGEAVVYNKRNWRYVQRVLENWSVNGRGEGNRDAANQGSAPEPFDPDSYHRKRRRPF
jgi:DnaD/phage-associated family protein